MIGLRLIQSLLQISIAFYRILTIAIIWFAFFKQIEPRIFLLWISFQKSV